MKAIRVLACSVCIVMMFSACSATPSNDSFQLIIFDENRASLHLGYISDDAFPILFNLDTNDSLFVIGLHEIDQYDWGAQVITLTEDATYSLVKAVDEITTDDHDQTVIDNIYQKLAEGIGTPAIWFGLDKKAFVVRVDGNPIYGGIFLSDSEPATTRYPVIRVTIADQKITFAVLPRDIPFAEVDSLEYRSDNSEISDMRKLIRDGEIRLLFEDAGKLKQ